MDKIKKSRKESEDVKKVEDVKVKVEEKVEEVKEKVEDIKEKVEEKVEEVKEKIEEIQEKAKEIGEDVKEKLEDATEKVEEVTEMVSERVKQAEEIAKKLPPQLQSVATESLEKLRERVGSMPVTPGSIITVLRYAMEVVELTQVKGKEQRDLAIYLVKQFIRDAPISDELEAKCLAVVEDDVLSTVIDTIIAATQGNLSVNLVRKNLLAILKAKCKCLFDIVSKVWKKKPSKK